VLIDPDGVDFRGVGAHITDAAGLREFVVAYKAGFPDLRHEVIDHVESGDTIALELRVKGTNSAARAAGRDAADWTRGRLGIGRLVKVRDGKVTSWHVYQDQLAFMEQMGLTPEPAAKPV